MMARWTGAAPRQAGRREKWRRLQQGRGDEPAVGDDHGRVGVEPAYPGPDPLVLEGDGSPHLQAGPAGRRSNRRRGQDSAPSPPGVGPGQNSDHLVLD